MYKPRKQFRYLNGYRLIYRPGHPNSMLNACWKGWIYEHIFVVSEHLGRPLCKPEVVHHKDFNRLNNSVDNLQLLTNAEHIRLHSALAAEKRNVNGVNSRKPKRCKACNGRGSGKPDAKQLFILLQYLPMSKLAERLNCTYKAIKYWANKACLQTKSARAWQLKATLSEAAIYAERAETIIAHLQQCESCQGEGIVHGVEKSAQT